MTVTFICKDYTITPLYDTTTRIRMRMRMRTQLEASQLWLLAFLSIAQSIAPSTMVCLKITTVAPTRSNGCSFWGSNGLFENHNRGSDPFQWMLALGQQVRTQWFRGGTRLSSPFSRSSSIWSKNCSCIFLGCTDPVSSKKRSARVDFPWSMWAMIEKLRMLLNVLNFHSQKN